MLRKSVVWVVCLVLVVVLFLPSGGADGLKVQAQEPEGEEDAFSPPTMVSSAGKRSDPQNRPAEGGEEVAAQGRVNDEEVAVIVGNSVIVWDPSPADVQAPVAFQITEGAGWRDIATGDFDGNGDKEIVVIDYGGWVRVYNPGGPPMSYEFSKLYPFQWIRVVTGDTDADGRDEIVVVSYPINDTSYVYVIDPIDFSERQGLFIGGIFYYIGAGRIYGDTTAEIGLVEYYEDDRKAHFFIWDPWTTVLSDQEWRGRFLGLAMGDMDKDGRDEVVLTRSGKHDPSLLGFDYYPAGNTILAYDLGFNLPGWGDEIGDEDDPGWGYIDFGDITGNSDEEIVAIRGIPKGAPDDFDTFMVNDPYPSLEPYGNPSESYHFDPPTEWEGVKLLDYDGDGNKEVVFRKDHYVSGYDWLTPGGDIWPFGSQPFLANLNGMAVGDFESPILQVNKEQLIFLMDRSNKNVIPPTQNFQINITSGVFNWSLTTSATPSWLTVLPTSGPEPATVGAQVITAVVPTDTEQSYTGFITISASESGVYDSPKVVTVTLQVLDNIFSVYGPHINR